MAEAYEYATPYKSDFFKDVPACALVEELQKRDGVRTEAIGPEESFQLTVDGPAIVLIVTD